MTDVEKGRDIAARIIALEAALRPFAFAAKHSKKIKERPHEFVLSSEFEAALAALEARNA